MEAIMRYTHVFYFIFTWIFVFIFIKPKRIKELLPVAVISVLTLTVIDVFLISLNLYQFNKPLINVLGAPLFHLLWAGPAGIVYVHYMKPGFSRKIVMIIFFTVVTLSLEFVAESTGVASRLNSYNIIHSAFIDFLALVALLWISEGLYGNRIYENI